MIPQDRIAASFNRIQWDETQVLENETSNRMTKNAVLSREAREYASIRVYDHASNVIETRASKADFKDYKNLTCIVLAFLATRAFYDSASSRDRMRGSGDSLTILLKYEVLHDDVRKEKPQDCRFGRET